MKSICLCSFLDCVSEKIVISIFFIRTQCSASILDNYSIASDDKHHINIIPLHYALR